MIEWHKALGLPKEAFEYGIQTHGEENVRAAIDAGLRGYEIHWGAQAAAQHGIDHMVNAVKAKLPSGRSLTGGGIVHGANASKQYGKPAMLAAVEELGCSGINILTAAYMYKEKGLRGEALNEALQKTYR